MENDNEGMSNTDYNDDLDADIKAAMSGEVRPEPAASDAELLEETEEQVAERTRDEKGKFAAKETAEETAEETAAPPIKPAVIEPPQGLTPAEKAEWLKAPPAIQAAFARREADFHKQMTAQDGDLAMGRKIKDIATPYVATIQAEGGTVEGAFKDLLNTAYILRTGSPQAKRTLILETAKQFGVDLGQQEETYEDPTIAALQNEIHQLKQASNPENLIKHFTQQQESAKHTQEAQAFAADTKNTHFDKVRPAMIALLGQGLASNLQEAYDKACWADDSIRPLLLQNKQTQDAAERKKQLDDKRRAGSSLSGSPAVDTATTTPNKPLSHNDDIDADIRAAMRAHSGGV